MRVTLAETSTSVPFSLQSRVPVAKHPVSHCPAAVEGPFCLSPSVYTCCLSFGGPSIRSVCAAMRVCMCVLLCIYMYTSMLLIFHGRVPAHAQTCVPWSSDPSIPDAVWENCVLLSDSSVSLTQRPARRPFTPRLSRLSLLKAFPYHWGTQGLMCEIHVIFHDENFDQKKKTVTAGAWKINKKGPEGSHWHSNYIKSCRCRSCTITAFGRGWMLHFSLPTREELFGKMHQCFCFICRMIQRELRQSADWKTRVLFFNIPIQFCFIWLGEEEDAAG